ncbi:MAG: glycosyltransferase [Bacteroidota bacterium]|nr:glycosyltransferase [Bacteroidota bacterium]MDP4250564.1 glycosyltransferase [Bacteroidota bacterium]
MAKVQTMTKRVVVSVISDLVTDQRVHKVCQTLHEQGFKILLIGSRRRDSLALAGRSYPTRRIGLLFQRKFPFYAEFNIRLFLRLLFARADIYLGNDLDVMPATWLAARLKKKPVVYDTHEYYMAMAGLDNKPFIRKIWKWIESFIFPRVQHIYTICDSFCELYKKDYGKNLIAVRNLPYLHFPETSLYQSLLQEIEQQIPKDKKILIFQGAGINPHRGAEELVMAMKYLDPEQYHLLIVGGGDIFPLVRRLILEEHLSDRISIIPKLPFEVLRSVTRKAQLGLSLDKAGNINHRYGLPNKIFDYLHAGLPVLVSRLVELEKVVNHYNVGSFIDSHEPKHIADCIEKIFEDPIRLNLWKKNTERVRQELNWENESKIIIDIFKQVERDSVTY